MPTERQYQDDLDVANLVNDPRVGPWTVRRSEHGYAVALERDGVTVLHLGEGTTRNEATVDAVVELLNNSPDERPHGQWQEDPPIESGEGYYWLANAGVVMPVSLTWYEDEGQWRSANLFGQSKPVAEVRGLWWSEPIQEPPAPEER